MKGPRTWAVIFGIALFVTPAMSKWTDESEPPPLVELGSPWTAGDPTIRWDASLGEPQQEIDPIGELEAVAHLVSTNMPLRLYCPLID
jgi:hypothetical protein